LVYSVTKSAGTVDSGRNALSACRPACANLRIRTRNLAERNSHSLEPAEREQFIKRAVDVPRDILQGVDR
jgi:hypothetical protein